MSIGFKQTSHIIEDSKPRVHGYLGTGPVSSDCHLESLNELAQPPEVASVSALLDPIHLLELLLSPFDRIDHGVAFVAFSPACRVALTRGGCDVS